MGVATNEEAHLNVLSEACERRSMAELELEFNDGAKSFARARLLLCDEASIMLDRPRLGDMPLELGSGTLTVVHFLHEGERYAFRSRVDQEGLLPCGGEVVQGVTLERPRDIHRQERRVDCRVSLAACGEVTAYFRRLPPNGDAPFPARLMNISAGGVAAIALDAEGLHIARGGQYVIDFELPDVPRRFCFRATLCHVRDLRHGTVIMGLKYLPESNAAEMRHAIRQVSQFVARQLNKDRA